MIKSKLNCLTGRFAVWLLIAAFFAGISMAKAQNAVYDKPLKYELSIDLVPVIDEGQFGKIYFKIKQFDGDQEKGAVRLGVSKVRYLLDYIDISSLPENAGIPYNSRTNIETELYIGYEKYKKIGSVLTYYGLDIKCQYSKYQQSPRNNMDTRKNISLGVCPFWGIKHYLLKNRVSAAFEIGWENRFAKITNLYNGMVSHIIYSDLRLPYNFTLNYHF